IKSGGSQRLDFGVADATACEVGLSCGGKISVLVMAVSETGFAPVLLADAAKSLAHRLPVGFCLPVHGGPARQAASLPAASALVDDEFWFVQAPRPQIIIIGAVHISQHLASMATQSGFDVTVIDPRRTFATADRFSGIKLVFDWPDRVLGEMALDQETALVALTHDPKIDDAALHLVLGKPLFHIACLGSRRTHAARLERLAAAGFDADVTAKIKGPAGLDIGAKTPAEIAISVLAELVAAFRGKIA
ncbi:MAG TPA: xanthine dehydrogenase, partial [Alphaproteobacteria bacterium]|nr:xanthine dehydrogenase [Alphaproteobacteria bacterium]